MINRTGALTLTVIGACVSLTQAFSGHFLVNSPWSSPGLEVINIETGATTILHSSGTSAPTFSPDGKKVAFTSNNELCIVNNDGTGLQRTGYNVSVGGLGYFYLTWNTDAIYHNDSRGKLYRYDLASKTARVIYADSGVGSMAGSQVTGYDQGAWISSDGMKAVMWTYRDIDPFHGANVLLDFNSAQTSYTRRYTAIWGHGWLMSRDGQNIVIISIAGGRSHRYLDVYSFARDSLLYFTAGPTGNVGEMGTGSVGYVANANDYITYSSSTDTSNIHGYIQNWKTGAYTEVHSNWKNFCTNKYLLRNGGGWLGALPSPTATTPEIGLDKSTVNFVSGGAAQNVTVTNIGAGTLTKVTAAVAPASSWLTVTVQGSGGNTQTIANAVNATGLTDGSYSATVTVSGATAANTASYTVNLSVGTGIAPPNGLTAIVTGVTARSVLLDWADNATNETGYAVERKKNSNGTYAAVRTGLAVNCTTWTDTGLDTGVYFYRVRAAGAGGTYSTYSSQVQANVIGLPSVTVTSPAAGQIVTDSTVHIRWNTNQVGSVEIKYSSDGGIEWKNINPSGGINTTMPSWGDFTWRVPDSMLSTVRVWVHQYSAPGFGGYSGVFSIRRSSSAVLHRTAGSTATGLNAVRRTGTGALQVDYSLGGGQTGGARVEVYSMQGARLAVQQLAPRAGASTATVKLPSAVGAVIVRMKTMAGTMNVAVQTVR